MRRSTNRRGSTRPQRLARLLGLVTTLLIPFVGAASAQTTWRMPTEYPASAVSGEALADFAERVARLGSGRLTVEPSYDAAFGLKSAEMVEAVRDGRIEAADAFGGGLAGTDPIFGLSSLPFVSNSVPQAKRLAEAARPVYDRAFAARGLRLLFVTPWPPTGLWSKTPLRSRICGAFRSGPTTRPRPRC